MAKHVEDTEVDVVSLTNKGGVGSTKNEDVDAIENSSSFANSNSDDAENSSRSSAYEVESVLFDKNGVACPSDPYDPSGPDVRMRNRKLTKHWRNFIGPLMSRLRWTEMKLRQLKSQEIRFLQILKGMDTISVGICKFEFGDFNLNLLIAEFQVLEKLESIVVLL
ncbi:hypothetical protein TSUD_272680 [Trifolium subterraneum]|uniref:Uncharacterized protein n=1 Tax=Trifolium subterraneum TaxID=3900 RepID=A0A2Z6P7L1_TRISU|nr:hypothetical protein TSUD_272680 [Trifolium subterraneum]